MLKSGEDGLIGPGTNNHGESDLDKIKVFPENRYEVSPAAGTIDGKTLVEWLGEYKKDIEQKELVYNTEKWKVKGPNRQIIGYYVAKISNLNDEVQTGIVSALAEKWAVEQLKDVKISSTPLGMLSGTEVYHIGADGVKYVDSQVPKSAVEAMKPMQMEENFKTEMINIIYKLREVLSAESPEDLYNGIERVIKYIQNGNR